MSAAKGQVLIFPSPNLQGPSVSYSAPTSFIDAKIGLGWGSGIRSVSVGEGLRFLAWPENTLPAIGPQGEAVGGTTVTGPNDVLRGTDPGNLAAAGDLNFADNYRIAYYAIAQGKPSPQAPPAPPPPAKDSPFAQPPPQNGLLQALLPALLLSSALNNGNRRRKRSKRGK